MATALGEVLVPRESSEWIGSPGDEKFVTVRMRGLGAVQRKIGEGKTPRPFRGSRVASGDLIYSRIDARNGAFALVPESLNRAVVSKDFPSFGLRPDRIEAAYLAHLVKAPDFWARFQSMSFGATNRQRIDERLLLAQKVYLPRVPEQRRIAAILDEADALREQNEIALARHSELEGAIFFELFGDPNTNSRGLPRYAMKSLGRVVTGNTPPRADSTNFGTYMEWVKTDNIATTRTLVGTATEYLSRTGADRARTVPAGSILVTCIAGSLRTIGNAALLDRTVAFNQQINAFVPEAVTSRFALTQLRALQETVRSASNGGMQGLVSKSRFEAIELIQPPPEAQREFEDRVRVLDQAASSAERRSAHLNSLFASLQHRAFRGEL